MFYRESTDTALLQRATADIRRAFVDHQRFTASWVFIATWDRVAFYGASGVMQNKVKLKHLIIRFIIAIIKI